MVAQIALGAGLGAAGVDMGRNIFQSDSPAAMIQAVGKVVHEGLKPEHAYDFFQSLEHEKKVEAPVGR